MENFLSLVFLDITFNQFIVLTFISFILFFWNIFVWKKFSNRRIANYQGIQRVHDGEIPRTGGLICLITIFISFILFDTYLDNYLIILLFILPLFLLSLFEDLNHSVHYLIRLSVMTITCFSIIYFLIPFYPNITTFAFIKYLFEFSLFEITFFTLALIILSNGFNFIDGMNGLLSFYIFGALLSCFTLCYLTYDIESSYFLVILLIPLVVFFIFNYPFGKIFLGDSGAYLYAILIGTWTINFFSKHEDISSWNTFLYLFYPTIEVIFSFIRKLLQKKSPFYPDRGHMHLKIFDLLDGSLKKPKISNNLVVIFLAVFWISPPLLLPWVYSNNYLIFFATSILFVTYSVLMFLLPEKK